MKSFLSLAFVACAALVIAGCSNPSETADSNTSVSSPLEADLCGKCGCCADCEDCCQGEKCECGMQKGSELCCTGVKPADVKYCKSCGFGKGTDQCCSKDNVTCSCGMAKGSPLCCKLKDGAGEHVHAEGEHTHGDGDAGHEEGHDKEMDSHDNDEGHGEHK